MRRSSAAYNQPIQFIQFHEFGDASGDGIGATFYSICSCNESNPRNGVTQRLVATNAPGEEGANYSPFEINDKPNLLTSVKDALMYGQFSGPSLGQRWTSVQAICQESGRFKQNLKWKHVSKDTGTRQIWGARGGDVQYKELWWIGPEWMADPESCPQDIVSPCRQSGNY